MKDFKKKGEVDKRIKFSYKFYNKKGKEVSEAEFHNPAPEKPKEKRCSCRGNLNANNPELPCSSCGGINPAKAKPLGDKRGWEVGLKRNIGPMNETGYLMLVDFISKLLSQTRQETIDSLKAVMPKQVSTRTWDRFFKNTSFEHSNSSRSIDIKCAYTNGYNTANSEMEDKIKKLEEEK